MSSSLWLPPNLSPISDFDIPAVEKASPRAAYQPVEIEPYWAASAWKRTFDFTVAAAGTVSLLPLFAIIAVTIKLNSKGPALFRQTRTGKGQVPFTIYKFRTMRTHAELKGPSVTRKDDARMTKTGAWLRRFKLDELPQLFNVLRGDMSLVGPRPKAVGHEQMDLICRPGITGVATLVFANEEDLLMEVPVDHVEAFTIGVLNPIKAELDMQYALEGSFATDLAILIKTALGLGHSNAITTLPELTEVFNSSQPVRQRVR